MLIVETADMLQAPLFTAEALLRAHGTIKLTHTQSHTCRVSACPYNDWHWQRPGSLVLKTNVICTQHSRFDSGLVPLLHVAFFSPCVFYVSTRLLSNKGKNARKKKKKAPNIKIQGYTPILPFKQRCAFRNIEMFFLLYTPCFHKELTLVKQTVFHCLLGKKTFIVKFVLYFIWMGNTEAVSHINFRLHTSERQDVNSLCYLKEFHMYCSQWRVSLFHALNAILVGLSFPPNM